MREQGTEPFTAAEARLAARLHRWSDNGVVAIDATHIAMRAATTSWIGHRARDGSWTTVWARHLILGLAALLLLAAGLALAAAATLLRTGTDPYRAVVVRQVDGGVDVVLAGADGRERVLRSVTPDDLGIDPRYTLGHANMGQAVNQQGWLQLKADGSGDDRTGLAQWGLMVLVDLADPARTPIILPANGFMSGRWGPDGQYALFCTANTQPPNCGQPMGTRPYLDAGPVRVFDPDLGTASEIIVPRVQTFGGGPEIFWTADGSGFLAREGTEWGVTPLDGGPSRPGAPKLLSREMDPSRPDLDDPGGWKVPGGDSGLAAATLVAAQIATDGQAIWQLLDDPAVPSPQALLARLTAPGTIESVRAFELPAGPTIAFTLSPDDTFVAIHVEGSGGWERFVLAPVGPGDATVTTGPVIEGVLAGLVAAATADTWPGP